MCVRVLCCACVRMRETHVDDPSKQPTPAGREHTRPGVVEEAFRGPQQATEPEAKSPSGQPALAAGPTSTIGSVGPMQAVSSSREQAGEARRLARNSVSSLRLMDIVVFKLNFKHS